MEMFIWISYDLGIQGDYSHMYAWLDNHEAKECGDSFAYIKYPIPHKMNDDEFLAFLKNDMESNIDFKSGDRVYVIRYISEKDSSYGTFLIGKRKAAPWEGYGNNNGDSSNDGE